MKKIYGIEYRNMQTAIHGFFVFEKKALAKKAFAALKDIENIENEQEYEDILDFVSGLTSKEYNFGEIDYHDVKNDCYFYDDLSIVKINNDYFDLYL